ncbi:hypothetical protein [Pedobacter mucosus]|uniref:hypothetical protein n=1 Tax=Pedobacter mucosus TaxID=2895286 RepID=UPI001EE45EA0|nr:hypothetical protein [Pedobacter mucosus]UKT64343.1 hypothetical protein LOK61_00880 [Pedobacter mucosus]
MKKFILMALVILFTSPLSFAQKLNTTNSFAKAIELAKTNNKLILLIVNVSDVPRPSTLNGVKVNFSSGLDLKEVIEKINENFIVYKTLRADTSIRSILSKSATQSFPAFLFLHPNKDLFFKDFGNSPNKSKYLTMIENALVVSKDKSLSDLEKDYIANKNDVLLLKKVIDSRKKVGISDNAELIEQYVNNLKIKDFSDYQTVLFILEAGPYADGQAYRLAFTNRKIVDSIYKNEAAQKRIDINKYIINNTMIAAIKTKNVLRAQSSANFTRNTWSKDYLKGQRAYSSEMLRYYLGVKDTANYLRNAGYHYDQYYMTLSADSIKKIEIKEHDAMMKRNVATMTKKFNLVSKERMDSLRKTPGIHKVTQTFTTLGSTSSTYATELNNAAWQFYLIGTKNINHLTKAMIWSRRSIELNPTGAFFDTLAHLLYRMNYVEEAIKTEEDAIEKYKLEGKDSELLKIELKKMKTRTM